MAIMSVALVGRGQAPARTALSTSSTSADVTPATFHSDLLDLSLIYPASLVAQRLPSLNKQHLAIAASHTRGEMAESRKSDQCTDKALMAVRQDDPNEGPPTITISKDKRGTVLTLPNAVTAKIVISRMGVDCMPDAYRNQLDNMAMAMSTALSEDRDLHPIDQPIWYDAGRARVHFAAGESDDKSAEPRWVGSAAFVWAGNLVSIVIESNDLPFFNEMLHSRIALGKDKGTPLFPADIGKGKPIRPKTDSQSEDD